MTLPDSSQSKHKPFDPDLVHIFTYILYGGTQGNKEAQLLGTEPPTEELLPPLVGRAGRRPRRHRPPTGSLGRQSRASKLTNLYKRPRCTLMSVQSESPEEAVTGDLH